MYASMYGAVVEIPPLCIRGSNRDEDIIRDIAW
jgi:hypothetical protein